MTTKNGFRNKMVNSAGLTVVQFKKEYNGACQIVSSIFKDLAKTYKEQVVFFVVDIEKQPDISEEYGIVEIPAILFFRAGKVVDHIKGLTSKNVMIAKIENALSTI